MKVIASKILTHQVGFNQINLKVEYQNQRKRRNSTRKITESAINNMFRT